MAGWQAGSATTSPRPSPLTTPSGAFIAHTLEGLHDLFRSQTSLVIRDIQGAKGEKLAALYSPELLDLARLGGVHSLLITPFGVGAELLGTIVAQRIHVSHAWTPAEVDAVESIAADLGRGLNHARLYEAENRLVGDLKALDVAKSDFFATVSHELRSPLTTIEGYLEMLVDEDADPVTERQRTMLATIGRSAAHLHNLVDDVFTLATLESSAFGVAMHPLRVADVVTGAVDAIRPSAVAAKLRLTCPPPAADLIVSGNPAQLERVLVNLLSNAVKFTPERGEVEVAAAGDDDAAVIWVRDTGIGIPEYDQKELFARYYRASNAVAHRNPGHRARAGDRPHDRDRPRRRVEPGVPGGRGNHGDRTAAVARARASVTAAGQPPAAPGPARAWRRTCPGPRADRTRRPSRSRRRPRRAPGPRSRSRPSPSLGHRLRDDLGGPGEFRQHPGPDSGHRNGHIHGLPQLRKLPPLHAVEGGADRGAQGGDRPYSAGWARNTSIHSSSMSSCRTTSSLVGK